MQIIFENLVKNSKSYKMLENDVTQNKLGGAYLFVSNDRVLLKVLSRLFAADALTDEILDKADSDKEKELVYKDIHTDVAIFPENDDKGKQKQSLYVADTEKIMSTLYKRPSRGTRKFYILDYAETLNDSSQNKLLKTLEEPPASSHFILNAKNTNSILPTVLSRCKKIILEPFDKDMLLNELLKSGTDRDTAVTAAVFSRGSLENVQRALSEKSFNHTFDVAIMTLLTLKSSKNILENSARLGQRKDALPEVLDFFELILRDVMLMGENKAEFITLTNKLNELTEISKIYSSAAALEANKAILKARKRIRFNGNAQSIIDELLFTLAETSAKYAKKI